LQRVFGVSERRACKVIQQHRSTQRRSREVADDEKRLTGDIHEVKRRWPRFGYRRITAVLRQDGWRVNAKRVHRICRAEGLQVRRIQRKRRRLGTLDGGVTRLHATHANHVWAYDFVHDRTEDGRRLKILTVVDEFTRECLAIEVARSITSGRLIELLGELALLRGVPRHIRSDNGPEFIARAVRAWLGEHGSQATFIEPGSPWENAYCESFNGKLRDELLDAELFTSLAEARHLITRYRLDDNHRRPHSSLGYLTPAAFAARTRTPLRCVLV